MKSVFINLLASKIVALLGKNGNNILGIVDALQLVAIVDGTASELQIRVVFVYQPGLKKSTILRQTMTKEKQHYNSQ